jgi:hypothetical protein
MPGGSHLTTLPGTRIYNYMSHPSNDQYYEVVNERFNIDCAPRYRQDIFGDVWPTTALERKKNRIKEFNKTWGIDKINDSIDKFNAAIRSAQKSSEERNEAIKKVFDSLSVV